MNTVNNFLYVNDSELLYVNGGIREGGCTEPGTKMLIELLMHLIFGRKSN